MSVRGAFSRSLIGEGGAENNRFASKAPNALTFFLSDGFIEKVRHLVRPPKPEMNPRITCEFIRWAQEDCFVSVSVNEIGAFHTNCSPASSSAQVTRFAHRAAGGRDSVRANQF
jgi:hypothetical protein